LAFELGKFIAHIHDAGVRHRDLHAGNILLELEANDRPRLHLIDLHDIRLGSPLTWRSARENLVLLNRWFAMRVDRPDRLRFWNTYSQCRGLGATGGQAAARAAHLEGARDLEQRTLASNRLFWRRRDQRSLRINRYYREVQSTTCAGRIVRDLDSSIAQKLCADPDEPFRRPGARWL
jgi:hypothetical protein